MSFMDLDKEQFTIEKFVDFEYMFDNVDQNEGPKVLISNQQEFPEANKDSTS